jgi:hypothetical protein
MKPAAAAAAEGSMPAPPLPLLPCGGLAKLVAAATEGVAVMSPVPPLLLLAPPLAAAPCWR